MSSKKLSSLTGAEIAVLVVLGIPVIIGFSALSGWFLMFLWNWALVGIFPAVPVLDFYRAWALSIFLSFIGSFFGGSSK